MKKKIIFINFILILLIFLNYPVFAKYKIEENITAIKIQIDRTAPKLNVSYKIDRRPPYDLEITISANEEIKEVEGWILQKDKKTLKKISDNKLEIIKVQDLSGNVTQIEVGDVDIEMIA